MRRRCHRENEETENGEGIAVHMNKCGINIIEEMNKFSF
jgi:hypothetical protein